MLATLVNNTMSFPFSSTLNSFFLPALNLATGRSDTTHEPSTNNNLLEISDVNISDLSIVDDPVTSETSFVVRVQHKSQHKSHRASPYAPHRPKRLGKLHLSTESPIVHERRRTLSEPSVPTERSVQSVTNTGKYKCVLVKSPGLVVHPENSSPVLFLAKELPPNVNTSTLKASLTREISHTCGNKNPACACESLVEGKANTEYASLLSALNDHHTSIFGGPSPGWNALRIVSATCSDPPPLEPPVSAAFCLLQLGGSDTLRIFPKSKSSNAHNLILEVPLGALAAVYIPPEMTSGSALSTYRVTNLGQGDPFPLQVFPVKVVAHPTSSASAEILSDANLHPTATSASNEPLPDIKRDSTHVPDQVSTLKAEFSETPESLTGKEEPQIKASDVEDSRLETGILDDQHSLVTVENSPLRSNNTTQAKGLTPPDLEPPIEILEPEETQHKAGIMVDQPNLVPPEKPPLHQNNNSQAEPTDENAHIDPDAETSASDDTQGDNIPQDTSGVPHVEHTGFLSTGNTPKQKVRPVGLFLPNDMSILLLDKVKPAELKVLAAACGVSTSNQDTSSAKSQMLTKFGLIYDGKAPLLEMLAVEVVKKLNSNLVNSLLDSQNVKFNRRVLLFDRRKILENHWLMRPAQQVPLPNPKKQAKRKSSRKKKKSSRTIKTSDDEWESNQSTSESEQEGEPKPPPTLDPPPALDPIAEEEIAQEQARPASPSPTSPTGANENQLFLLERSILDLRSDMDKNNHCLELLLDEEPRKGSKSTSGLEELRKSLTGEIKSLLSRFDSLQKLVVSTQQLCESQGKTIKKLEDDLKRLATTSTPSPEQFNEQEAAPAPVDVSRKELNHSLYSSTAARYIPQAQYPPRRIPENSVPSRQAHKQDAPTRNTSAARRKVVVLHDGSYENFDQSMFANRYEVEMIRCPSLRKAASDEALLRRIRGTNAFAAVVHLGTKDIHDGRPVNNTLKDAKAIMTNLAGTMHTCMSLPIVPHSVDHIGFVDKLNEFNQALTNQITYWRRSPPNGMRMKVYTCTKPMLTPAARVVASEPHIKIIAAPARKKLWLKLKDAMDRMSGLLQPRVKHQPRDESEDSNRRQTYRRNTDDPRATRPNYQEDQNTQPNANVDPAAVADNQTNNSPNDE